MPILDASRAACCFSSDTPNPFVSFWKTGILQLSRMILNTLVSKNHLRVERKPSTRCAQHASRHGASLACCLLRRGFAPMPEEMNERHGGQHAYQDIADRKRHEAQPAQHAHRSEQLAEVMPQDHARVKACLVEPATVRRRDDSRDHDRDERRNREKRNERKSQQIAFEKRHAMNLEVVAPAFLRRIAAPIPALRRAVDFCAFSLFPLHAAHSSRPT
ncbi:hypothetical protein [Paraburkholderia kururiensis]|uniref:Uncharacterized protein n=1 Tax=Paraburkholderia kururiensis TaxID=984307 RepID=A0ABZ0WL30_9BURK|nr:hypothetical protein [Paraburkholderia kururiensis]WQD78053.1 hypothetical protein U0042_29265 [Paraburkholderia kururiensis]